MYRAPNSELAASVWSTLSTNTSRPDVWDSSDPNNRILPFTVSFFDTTTGANMLDWNGNNITDPDELLVPDGSLENGFIGYDGGIQYGGDTPQFASIPEPSSLGLFGLGALALASRRRQPSPAQA